MVRHRPEESGLPTRRSGTIRDRLVRILAFPLVAVLVLLGVVVAGYIGQYRDAQGTRSSVNLALAVNDLTYELQEERGLTTGMLSGDKGFRSDLLTARTRLDEQRSRLARLATGDVTGAEDVRAALDGLTDLDSARAKVDAGKVDGSASFDDYTARIQSFRTIDFGLDRSSDLSLRRGDQVLASLNDVEEYAAQEQASLSGVFSTGSFKASQYEQFVQTHVTVGLAQARAQAYATPAQLARATQVLLSPSYEQAEKMIATALSTPDARLGVDPQLWWSALAAVLDGIHQLQQSLGADIQNRAASLQRDATSHLVILLCVVLLCITGAVALMVVAARSITRPLAILAEEADALAQRRLPEAVSKAQFADEDDPPTPPEPVRVPARAGTEIESVAAALAHVQATAYQLATEQALLRRTTTESLANLGRRNQNLLRRQIGFITRLEQEENDPSGLANLFELDHLATRMRRNAESLLVLVGEASPRSWSAPLPIADMIRAAVSEVEDYRRVALRHIDEAYVGGAYVTPLVHMIAELVENGLAYSPPDLDVEIQGRRLGHQYLIAITDQGVGMDAADLAKANARLSGRETFLTAPARYLGHYVVGHLAQQMGVGVDLGPSPATGITARVLLPAPVLATPAQLEMAATQQIAAVAAPSEEERPQPLAGRLPDTGRRVPAIEYVTTPDPPDPAAPAQTDRNGASAEPATLPRHDAPARRTAPGTALPVRTATSTGPTQTAGTAGTTGPTPAADTTATADAPTSLARTRNGLARRPPRGRDVPAPSPVDRGDQPPAMDESPEQVRDRLMSLRAGLLRAEQQREQTAYGQSDFDERGNRVR